ncbi:hypothetical protein [Verminephrobacter eiseniae]|uniref:hypothetical protein n=1 Tax=Verminephrobacter eiseniae TaxID=364317 RepID=UPI0022374A37|nr:hypothetical protein [Verminephrobacter eiseniae]MCW5231707.1 hypothetical protein [Verminephrobacter eiseniae]MCW5293438.1 hypothetical protein [Verminephrobacter eiseniae]MCW8186924.1 hypothetical protein [Verminephrobacter eiseniae]MCW8225293.1 hypothetical protein [Verminephrobacter eiseniae]MCW8236300.1 hypothetical protein [Verminephrobacter eiseniae]
MNKKALTKPAIGVLVGASLALAASAGASQTSGASSGVSSQMAAVDAAMTQKMQDDLKNCDDVGIGASIKTAIGAHSQMASATPNVESLFDVNDSCFASVSQIIDLSFSIPSLGSILSSAQDAVLKYAQKKVCSTVGKVSGMVTSPINQAIGQWNTLGQQFTDINGMANSAVGGSLSTLDPQLGSAYKPASAATGYSVNANAFGSNQTVFSAGASTQQGAQTAPATSVQPQASQQPTEPQSFTSWAAGLFN